MGLADGLPEGPLTGRLTVEATARLRAEEAAIQADLDRRRDASPNA